MTEILNIETSTEIRITLTTTYDELEAVRKAMDEECGWSISWTGENGVYWSEYMRADQAAVVLDYIYQQAREGMEESK